MQNYKLLKDRDTNEISGVLELTNNWWIPKDEGNRHYQEYLAWLAEGNEPEPADEPQQEEPPVT